MPSGHQGGWPKSIFALGGQLDRFKDGIVILVFYFLLQQAGRPREDGSGGCGLFSAPLAVDHALAVGHALTGDLFEVAGVSGCFGVA